eukprot:2995198-Karenia_brevis.AAC.1
MQENEYTEKERQLQEDLGLAEPDNKRKEEGEEEVAPERKRRRTQEEEDWYGEFWTDKDKSIGVVERSEIEDKVDKWIQEINEVIEESESHMEEMEEEEWGKPVWNLRTVEECWAVT